MPRPVPVDYSTLIAHQTVTPGRQAPLSTPRRARCTARTYGGDVVTMDGFVTHRAGRWLSFHADYPGCGEWTAWVDARCCEPL